MPMPGCPVRDAARVAVLDGRDRVLMLQIREPGTDNAWWIVPGGGLHEGETAAQAAARELREETGLEGLSLVDTGYRRRVTFRWRGDLCCQDERFFVARLRNGTAPNRPAGLTAAEQVELVDRRWWTVGELAASDERIAPADLGSRLPAWAAVAR